MNAAPRVFPRIRDVPWGMVTIVVGGPSEAGRIIGTGAAVSAGATAAVWTVAALAEPWLPSPKKRSASDLPEPLLLATWVSS